MIRIDSYKPGGEYLRRSYIQYQDEQGRSDYLFFSYETLVAIHRYGERGVIASKGKWSVSTNKHLWEIRRYHQTDWIDVTHEELMATVGEIIFRPGELPIHLLEDRG